MSSSSSKLRSLKRDKTKVKDSNWHNIKALECGGYFDNSIRNNINIINYAIDISSKSSITSGLSSLNSSVVSNLSGIKYTLRCLVDEIEDKICEEEANIENDN